MRTLPPILGVSEVMQVLGVSQNTVLRLVRAGDLDGRKLGPGRTAAWAFTGESVATYLANRKAS